MIQKYSLCLFNSDTEDDYFLLRNDFDEMIEDISSIYISNNYIGLFSWLIGRAFNIGCGVRRNKNTKLSITENNKVILLQTLYNINSKMLLKCFKNG